MSIEKKTIRVGVIGVGCIAQKHLFSLTLITSNARKLWDKKVRIVLQALCDIDEIKLNAINKHFPAKKLYTDGMELIKDPEVDAVYVLVPTVDHKKFVIAAANAGKHVFVEKPIAFSPKDIDEMITARDKSGVNIQIGLVFRSAPQIVYMKEYFKKNQTKQYQKQ